MPRTNNLLPGTGLAVALALALAGCDAGARATPNPPSTQATTPTARAPMPRLGTVTADTSPEGLARGRRNTATVESFFAYLNAKDIDSWINLWAEDGRILQPYPPDGGATVTEGRAQILPGFREVFTHFIDFTADIRAIYPTVNPDIVIAEYANLVHLTNGQTYTNDNIAVFEFRDGKIAVYHDYYDPRRFQVVIDALNE